jgi:hypothetical protein
MSRRPSTVPGILAANSNSGPDRRNPTQLITWATLLEQYNSGGGPWSLRRPNLIAGFDHSQNGPNGPVRFSAVILTRIP